MTTLKVIRILAAFLILTLEVYSAPLDPSGVQIVWMNGTTTSSIDVSDPPSSSLLADLSLDTAALLMAPGSTMYVILSPLTDPPTVQSSSLTTQTSTVSLTQTVLITDTAAAVTVTYTASPTTVVDTVVITSSTSLAQSKWVAPAQMTDLSAFNISHIADGAVNLGIATGIPANASASPSFLAAEAIATQPPGAAGPNSPSWDNSSAVLQLFYPANSVNPKSNILGGAEFYATPLNLTGSNRVSLGYSVFFPQNFDWVEGGKLPGLYGGHTGCSGGDDSTTCFSTRLMWRSGGAGELYLYAPKDKQTEALCKTPPESFCDQEYGLSIGRGSFKFAAGAWTHVNQTVELNTPGKQDGGFTLLVNGQSVINRADVFYRDVVKDSTPPKTSDPAPAPPKDTLPPPPPPPPSPPPPSGLGGLLGGLGGVLGGLIGDILYGYGTWPSPAGNASIEAVPYNNTGEDASPPPLGYEAMALDIVVNTTVATTTTSTTTISPTETTTLQWRTTTTTTLTVSPTSTDSSSVLSLAEVSEAHQVGFIGLFFSTFFGGHEQNWATPKDQYSYFKDFAMSIDK